MCVSLYIEPPLNGVWRKWYLQHMIHVCCEFLITPCMVVPNIATHYSETPLPPPSSPSPPLQLEHTQQQLLNESDLRIKANQETSKVKQGNDKCP